VRLHFLKGKNKPTDEQIVSAVRDADMLDREDSRATIDTPARIVREERKELLPARILANYRAGVSSGSPTSGCAFVHYRCRFVQSSMQLVKKSVVWLCVALILSSALAVALHHHSNANDAVKCAACVAAHSACPQNVAIVSSFTLLRIISNETKVAFGKQHFLPFALFMRPPPAA
jgi:hypothetical protein